MDFLQKGHLAKLLSKFILCLGVVFISNIALAQTRIILNKIPANTPSQDPIYLTGSFNDWNPSDEQFRLKRNAQGKFQISIPNTLIPFEYKVCRGQLELTEGDQKGQEIKNRQLVTTAAEVAIEVASWIDLEYYELIVTRIPPNTPVNDPIYVAGRFNNWLANEKQYKLEKRLDGTYSVRIPGKFDTLEYKYNRGSWEGVEGDDIGNMKSNNFFVKNGTLPIVIKDQIRTWEDLETVDSFTFVIEDLPENTPFDAAIYIVGNFNNWEPGNPAYKFTKLDNNTFTYTLPGGPDTLEYKFTRGTWDSVEGGNNGRAIENRKFYRTKGGAMTIYATVKTWEDFAGTSISYHIFILIISIVIAVLLLAAFNWMERGDHQTIKLLSLAMAFFIIAVFGRVLMNYRDVFNWQPKLILLPDIIFFTYAPLMYFYFQKLLSVQPRISISKWISFIPAGVLFVSYLPFLVIDPQVFIDKIINREFHTNFAIIGAIALIYNFIYWVRCLKVLQIYTRNLDNTQSFDQSHYYLNSVLTLNAICLFLWLATYLIGGVGYLFPLDTQILTHTAIDITWVIFSANSFLMAYFALNQPELFRITEVTEKYKYSHLTEELASKLRRQLSTLMEEEKPFLNPKLTLLQLAEMLETNTNTLSRTINEGYDRNFYDFVNFYRIEEFKKLVNQDDHKNYTFLSIAYEVGFSSKTTFNRAFKKLEGITPREYYKNMLASESSNPIEIA